MRGRRRRDSLGGDVRLGERLARLGRVVLLGDRRTLWSPHPVPDCRRRLERGMAPIGPAGRPWRTHGRRTPTVAGRVSDRSFAVLVVVPRFHSFQPTLEGVLIPLAAGTAVETRVRLDATARVLAVVSLVAVPTAVGVLAAWVGFGVWRGLTDLAAIILVAGAAVAIVFSWSYRSAAGEGDRLVAWVRETLDAEDLALAHIQRRGGEHASRASRDGQR